MSIYQKPFSQVRPLQRNKMSEAASFAMTWETFHKLQVRYPFLSCRYFGVHDTREELLAKVSATMYTMNAAELKDPEIGGLFLHHVIKESFPKSSRAEATQMLIDAGCCLDVRQPMFLETHLMAACYWSDSNLIRVLMATGHYDLFAKTKYDKSAVSNLVVSHVEGREDILKDICNAFPNEVASNRTDCGRTLLHRALTPGAVRVLMGHVDPNIKCNKGHTAIEYHRKTRDLLHHEFGDRAEWNVNRLNLVIDFLEVLSTMHPML